MRSLRAVLVSLPTNIYQAELSPGSAKVRSILVRRPDRRAPSARWPYSLYADTSHPRSLIVSRRSSIFRPLRRSLPCGCGFVVPACHAMCPIISLRKKWTAGTVASFPDRLFFMDRATTLSQKDRMGRCSRSARDAYFRFLPSAPARQFYPPLRPAEPIHTAEGSQPVRDGILRTINPGGHAATRRCLTELK